MSPLAADLGLINTARLSAELDSGNLDAVVATSPENTFYLSGVLIRTQISIRERLAQSKTFSLTSSLLRAQFRP